MGFPVNIKINSQTQACVNQSPFTLNAGRPIGGFYSGPYVHNGEFYPDSAGVGQYTTTYSYNSQACGTAIDTFTLTVNPPPAVPGVLVNPNFLRCDVSAAGYQWFDANGAISGATARSYTRQWMVATACVLRMPRVVSSTAILPVII
ncbi:MAG: hypothetical protein U5L96_00765 [Owenweeksia sp.]|nr:hypothetical protein [Owenweeksia sp.]